LDLYQENQRVSDLDQTKQDILMVGVGGQGIILASDILGEAALEKGLDVKKTDTLGMAQRGGSVTSHLRIGQKVWSPLISPAEADILLAFEKLEAARWVNYLKPGGLAIINNLAIPPLSISLGSQKYPGDQEILDSFKQRTSRLCLVDGSGKIAHLGDTRTLNIFMLGFLSTFLPLDIDSAAWESCLRKQLPSRILDINLRAFEKGREEALSVNIR
jgi:indolepyruvate ferredoxin oxidoreductase beta subunit